MRPFSAILRQQTGIHPDHQRNDALRIRVHPPLVRHLCATIFTFSRIVTHELAEMRLGNHPDQPLHPPIAPPWHALQPASALSPLQPSRTTLAALDRNRLDYGFDKLRESPGRYRARPPRSLAANPSNSPSNQRYCHSPQPRRSRRSGQWPAHAASAPQCRANRRASVLMSCAAGRQLVLTCSKSPFSATCQLLPICCMMPTASALTTRTGAFDCSSMPTTDDSGTVLRIRDSIVTVRLTAHRRFRKARPVMGEDAGDPYCCDPALAHPMRAAIQAAARARRPLRCHRARYCMAAYTAILPPFECPPSMTAGESLPTKGNLPTCPESSSHTDTRIPGTAPGNAPPY